MKSPRSKCHPRSSYIAPTLSSSLGMSPEEPLIDFFLVFGSPKAFPGTSTHSLLTGRSFETAGSDPVPAPQILDSYPTTLSSFLKSINLVSKTIVLIIFQ